MPDYLNYGNMCTSTAHELYVWAMLRSWYNNVCNKCFKGNFFYLFIFFFIK